jgi:hypothetical protein
VPLPDKVDRFVDWLSCWVSEWFMGWSIEV